MWRRDMSVWPGDTDAGEPVSADRAGRWRYDAGDSSVVVDLWGDDWADWVVDPDDGVRPVTQGRATGGPLPALLAAVVLHACELGVVSLSAHERAHCLSQAVGVDLGEWR